MTTKTKVILGLSALALFLAVAIPSCAVSSFGDGGWEVSEGYRSGTLQKFSHKSKYWGAIKTWEGELSQSGAGGSQVGKTGQANQSALSVWAFSVSDENVAKELTDRLENGDNSPLNVHYKEYYYEGRYDTGYRVDRVVHHKEQ